jgi:hypothetical protein
MSSEAGKAPVLISLTHGLHADPIITDFIEYYEYANKTEDYRTKRIYADEDHDEPFAEVEPITGVSTSLVLKFQTGFLFYRDYFPRNRNFTEIAPGRG